MRTLTQRLFQGGAVFLGALIFEKISTAVLLIILGRQLTTSDFGMLMLGVTITNLLSLIGLLGLPTAAVKFLSGKQGKAFEESFYTILLLALVYVLILVVCLLPLHSVIARIFSQNPAFAPLIFIAIAGIPAQGAYRIFESVLQSGERNKQLFWLSIVNGVAKIGAPVLLYYLTRSIVMAMVGFVLAYAISAIAAAIMMVRQGYRCHYFPRKAKFAEIARFAFPTMIVGFSYVLASHADRLMVGAFRDEGEVGIYAAAGVIAMSLSLLHIAFDKIFLPVASDLYNRKEADKLGKLYAMAARWSTFCSGVGVLILAAFGIPILGIFGPEFKTEAAYYTLIILSLFYFFATIFGPTTSVLQMGGSHKREGGNALLFLGTNVTLNLVLVPLTGMLGAALATMLSGLLRNLIQAYQLHGRHDLRALNGEQITYALIVCTLLLVQFVTPTAYAAPISLVGIAALCATFYLKLSGEEKLYVNSLGIRLQTAIQDR